MSWKRKIARTAIAVGLLVIIAIVGGYAYLKSASFERYALRKISEAADESIGAKTTVGGLDFSLSSLSANLNNITLRGSENADQAPLLHIDKLTVQMKIVSLLHRQFLLRELLVEHPVVHLQVSKEGKNNIPPSRNSSGHTSVFDLAVGHAQLTDGELDYNDRKTPLDADLWDLATDIRFAPNVKKYEGVLSYRNGRLRYATYRPIAHSVDLKFSATPEQLKVESAALRVGESDVKLQALLVQYSNPNVDGLYQIRLHTPDLAQLYPSVKPQGDVMLTGSLHYQSSASEPLLEGVSVDGRIASEALNATASGKTVNLRKVEGNYRLAGGNLVLNNLSVDTLGGRITARGEMHHLDAIPDSRIEVSLNNISLRALQQTASPQRSLGAVISGMLSGKAEALWKGSVQNIRVQSDLSFQAQATRESNPQNAEIPVNGAVHAVYDGRRQSIELSDTVLKIPTATVTAQGTISSNSRLDVRAVADDLHQLAGLAASFGGAPNAAATISGNATLNATIQGSLKSPNIAAQLNASDLSVEGTEWRVASLAIHANPSELVIQNGTLTSAHQGQALFNARIKLHDWSYEPSDRIQAQLNARQLRVADLQRLANQHYPVAGELSARLSLDGTQLQPAGTAQIEIVDASVYGEPLQKLAVDFRADNGSLSSNLNLAGKAGSIKGTLTYTPKTKAYKVKLDAPSLVLQHLQALQAENAQIRGTVTASVNGEGTIDDPQLVATVELPELQVKGKSFSEIKAEARIAQHRLDFSVDSKVSQIPVRAQGQIALVGDYQAQANFDTGTIPLDTLLAAYTPKAPQGFQGQTEVHASLQGPLKDRTHVEAHLSIPVLKASYQSLQAGIAKPIHADYQNSVVTLQPTDIEGTGTSLQIQGQFPIDGRVAPSITANGSVDLRILKIVAPDVQSSGLLALDLRVAGTSNQPTVQGQVQLKDVGLTTQDAPIGVEKLNGTLDALSDRLQITQMNGVMGGGNFSIGGSIAYRPGLHFNLAMQSQSVRLLYPTGLRSQLDANLSFTGTPATSTLNGRVLIDSLGFTPDFDLSTFSDQFSAAGTASQPGFADTIKLAIAVQSRQNLSATSSQVSITGQAALQVGGTAANPVIIGRTTLTSGELFYRNVRYQLKRGVITFDDPNATHPVFNVSVTTTIEQYNLTLTLRGPLDKLRTSYVSDPPLATADIVNLVARGKTTQESAASSQSTDSMIASQAAGQLGSSVQKLAGISSLQIDPTLGGNGQNPSARIAVQQRVTKDLFFTFSTDVSQPGSEMVQGEYQINKRWSVSVTRDQLGGISVDGRFHSRF